MPVPEKLVEQAARRQRLRSRAVELGLSGVLVFSRRRATLGWFTGYTPGYLSNSGWLWVPADGDDVMGVGFAFDGARAAETSGLSVVSDVSPAETIDRRADGLFGLVAADAAVDETPLALMRLADTRGLYVDLHDEVAAWRATKTPPEVERLRALAIIAADALQECPDVIGLDDFTVAATIEAAVRRRGAERVLCLLGIGDGAVVTEARGRRVGEADVVCVELTFHGDGGCMHVNSTIPSASPTAAQRRALEVCRSTRALLIDKMRPGVAVDEVVRYGDAALAAAGFLEIKEYDFGHGIGPDTPEYPRLVAGDRGLISAGMVVAVHVALRGGDGHTAFVGGPIVVGDEAAAELVPHAPWSRDRANGALVPPHNPPVRR